MATCACTLLPWLGHVDQVQYRVILPEKNIAWSSVRVEGGPESGGLGRGRAERGSWSTMGGNRQRYRGWDAEASDRGLLLSNTRIYIRGSLTQGEAVVRLAGRQGRPLKKAGSWGQSERTQECQHCNHVDLRSQKRSATRRARASPFNQVLAWRTCRGASSRLSTDIRGLFL